MENRLKKNTMERTTEEKEGDKEEEEEAQSKTIMGVFTKEQFVMLCVGVGLVLLLLVIAIPAILLTQLSGSSPIKAPSPSDGDMLDYLLENDKIPAKDGLYATWYHSANSKSELTEALTSPVMVLEADVNVRGHGTPNETTIPIMAHPPDVDSDNTLDEWMDAVLKSDKGIKLDFKSIESVGPSLDILRLKNQSVAMNRPVWLNADILHGPNVPSFIPVVNGERFLQLIQQKFPEVTISPGWKVLHVPQLPNKTYTEAMMMDMYDAIRHVPQKVTFPVMAVMAKKGWPHISWLLSQSSRFSLTLWQGKVNPTVNDLLFIRDNSNPQRVYYDIYEPVLSQFKEAAEQKNRPRRFYPGGDLIDYFRPKKNDGLNIPWQTVKSRDFLLSLLQDRSGGMLVIPVMPSAGKPKRPVVASLDQEAEFPLQDCLDLILASGKKWGIFLLVKSESQLVPSLQLLNTVYDQDRLYHPIWVSMEVSHGAFWTQGYMSGVDFLSTVEDIFPYVTLAPAWPKESLAKGYTSALVDDMLQLFGNVYQEVSLQLDTKALGRSDAGLQLLQEVQKRFSLTVEVLHETDSINALQHIRSLGQVNKSQLYINVQPDYWSNVSNLEDNF